MADFRWFNDRQVRQARANLRAAQAELDENSEDERRRGVCDETPEYLRLNARVNELREELRHARP